jgi:hypothetical protein
MILKIGSRASIEVSSLEGASTFPDGTLLDGNRIIARVSYNAKVWPPTKWIAGQAPLFDPHSK